MKTKFAIRAHIINSLMNLRKQIPQRNYSPSRTGKIKGFPDAHYAFQLAGYGRTVMDQEIFMAR
jgi:hypothetical protein